MYEMYPDDWAATAQPATNGNQPRRRARRVHSVTPSILVQEKVVQESPGTVDVSAQQD